MRLLGAIAWVVVIGCARTPEPKQPWPQPHTESSEAAERDAQLTTAEAIRKRLGVHLGKCDSERMLAMRQADGCSPCVLSSQWDTVEGTPAAREVFVFPSSDGCHVVGFFDYRGDYYGGCRLIRRSCSTVAGMFSDNSDTEGGCTQDVLETRTPCENPHPRP